MTLTATVQRELTAGDVMSSHAVVLRPDNTLWDASRLMSASGVRHLVMCFRGRVVGVIDDRTVFAHWPMGPQVLRGTHLADVVRRRTSCVLEDVELRRVAELMVIDAADAVPVVDEEGNVLGIITTSDLVAAVASHGITEETA